MVNLKRLEHALKKARAPTDGKTQPKVPVRFFNSQPIPTGFNNTPNLVGNTPPIRGDFIRKIFKPKSVQPPSLGKSVVCYLGKIQKNSHRFEASLSTIALHDGGRDQGKNVRKRYQCTHPYISASSFLHFKTSPLSLSSTSLMARLTLTRLPRHITW